MKKVAFIITLAFHLLTCPDLRDNYPLMIVTRKQQANYPTGKTVWVD